MKRVVVKYTHRIWAGAPAWEATVSVDGEEFAGVSGRDYLQVAVAVQGYVMNLAGEADGDAT